MFWFFLLFIIQIPDFIITSDNPMLSGTAIKIKAKDAPEQLPEYALEFVKYSKTVQDMIEDLGSYEEVIPLAQITDETFKCLMTDFVKSLFIHENKANNARELFRAYKKNCPKISASDLLIQSNILDMKTLITDNSSQKQIPFISLIASLYADSLKTEPLNIIRTTEGTISCDDVPHELEPFVAGWLLHDLYKDMKPEIIKPNFKYSGVRLERPIFSNPGSDHGFSCIWPFGAIMSSARYVYFDDTKQSKFQENLLGKVNYQSQCALSADGIYMLVVHSNGSVFSTTIQLYDISIDHKNINRKIDPFFSESIHYKSIFDLKALLFNAKENAFDIIFCSQAAEGTETKGALQKFAHYRLFITTKELSTIYTSMKDLKNDLFNGEYITFNYVDDTLIGTWKALAEKIHIAIFGAHDPIEGLFDTENNQWFYYKGEVKYTPNCTIISTTKRPNRTPIDVAIQNSFIPDFEKITSEKLNTYNVPYANSTFDATHLCHYCEHNINYEVAVLYPGNKKFVKGMNILNARWAKDNSNVLIDAFFMDRFHRYPDAWEIECKDILTLISKEIQKAYNIEQELEIQKLKKLGWIQALRQGKFMPYAHLKWQSFYGAYKTPLKSGLAIGGIGFAAWYFNKYGIKNWLPSFKMNKSLSSTTSKPVTR